MALAERQVQAQWAVDPQHDPTECHDRRVTDLRCHPHGVTARQLRFQGVPFPSEGWVRAMQSRRLHEAKRAYGWRQLHDDLSLIRSMRLDREDPNAIFGQDHLE